MLGLKLGDTVTVNVLGRDVTATIFNLRKVEWRNLAHQLRDGLLAGTFKGAPHSDLATLSLPGGPDAATENRILRGVAKEFPSVTSVRVKDALDAVGDLVGRLVLAIRGASGVAILASLLVLGAPWRRSTGRGSTMPWC